MVAPSIESFGRRDILSRATNRKTECCPSRRTRDAPGKYSQDQDGAIPARLRARKYDSLL